jgi:DNA-binding response OmpR family regulator
MRISATNTGLSGHLILVVEDEPLIALEIARALEDAGAQVVKTSTLKHALEIVEQDGLSAAILDHALGEEDASQLCERLKQRRIPFVMYSGYETLEGACHNAPHVSKPIHPSMLVATMAGLLRGQHNCA